MLWRSCAKRVLLECTFRTLLLGPIAIPVNLVCPGLFHLAITTANGVNKTRSYSPFTGDLPHREGGFPEHFRKQPAFVVYRFRKGFRGDQGEVSGVSCRVISAY
jgi:hypothetical protein